MHGLIVAVAAGALLPPLASVASAAEPQQPVVMTARHRTRVERNVLIPMRDGTRLAADLVMPNADGVYPAILEYHPYRKDDITRSGLDVHHYFAERGFVGVRLDVRGTGGSEGVNTDEYLPQEQLDGYDAVEWLAGQPWCNGRVGMFGTSYGGFTCIQVAMHRPPHLTAIVPMYATDDRYTDDCHYSMGGAMRMYYDVGTYGGFMVAMNALPPLPELAGPRWAEMWQERLEQNQPYLLEWIKHQTDGPYWRSASLRPDYDRVACPVFLIGGWRDGYSNTMLRMYQHLQVPKKLLMGPWTHMRPNTSVPGPRIDYLNEVCRFFAYWLRDEDTLIMAEPPVATYMQEYITPSRTLDITPGAWRQDAQWPVPGAEDYTLYLADGGRLDGAPPGEEETADSFDYCATTGTANGYWSAGGISFYLADDQRADEAYSLVYTSLPLEGDLHLLGWPRMMLHASSTARVATFVCKLADVAPDGHSALIVDGNLNATRRRSLSDPEPLEPGEIYELDVPMYPTGWVVRAGHRLRLAISGADFPNLWPTPEPATHTVYHSAARASRVVLPVVPPSELPPPAFLPPPTLVQLVRSSNEPPVQEMRFDQISGTATLVKRSKSTLTLEDQQGQIAYEAEFRCSANAGNPAQASILGTHSFTIRREDGEYVVVGESAIRATADAFHIVIDITITRNGRPFFNKRWTASEPRRLL